MKAMLLGVFCVLFLQVRGDESTNHVRTLASFGTNQPSRIVPALPEIIFSSTNRVFNYGKTYAVVRQESWQLAIHQTPLKKDPWDMLYYTRYEYLGWPQEGTDVFGKIWRISPRLQLIAPTCYWDNPTARTERIIGGVSFVFRW